MRTHDVLEEVSRRLRGFSLETETDGVDGGDGGEGAGSVEIKMTGACWEGIEGAASLGGAAGVEVDGRGRDTGQETLERGRESDRREQPDSTLLEHTFPPLASATNDAPRVPTAAALTSAVPAARDGAASLHRGALSASSGDRLPGPSVASSTDTILSSGDVAAAPTPHPPKARKGAVSGRGGVPKKVPEKVPERVPDTGEEIGVGGAGVGGRLPAGWRRVVSRSDSLLPTNPHAFSYWEITYQFQNSKRPAFRVFEITDAGIRRPSRALRTAKFDDLLKP
ncbi:hypothetical protein T484DRAFT_3547295 [Baffinella frigidus]|nr:hypothetical protein T484DRAFT_3547295 [Cryptophyta sp. CCMP2293]